MRIFTAIKSLWIRPSAVNESQGLYGRMRFFRLERRPDAAISKPLKNWGAHTLTHIVVSSAQSLTPIFFAFPSALGGGLKECLHGKLWKARRAGET